MLNLDTNCRCSEWWYNHSSEPRKKKKKEEKMKFAIGEKSNNI